MLTKRTKSGNENFMATVYLLSKSLYVKGPLIFTKTCISMYMYGLNLSILFIFNAKFNLLAKR